MATYFRLPAIVGILILILITSCGGGKTSVENQLVDDQTGLMGMPLLNELPEANHDVSFVGPGWFNISLSEALQLRNSSVVNEILTVSGTTDQVGYALFGVFGFEEGSGPTSLRLSVIGPDNYWIAVSDYKGCCWENLGPFSGSTTFEYPIGTKQPSPDAYISENRTSYVTIITEPGNSIQVTNLELGIYGGTNAPDPPFAVFASSNGTNSVYLTWRESISGNDPDFAGYIVERCPATSLEVVQLTPGPIKETFYQDGTVSVGDALRYRIRAVDVNGNSSFSVGTNAFIELGNVPNPVAVLDLPQTPKWGPVDVTIDMSRSFDPAGVGIDTYILEFGKGIEPIITTSDSITRSFPPGLYWVRLTTASGGRIGMTSGFLKVYPRWKKKSYVVSNPPQIGPKLNFTKAINHPVTNRPIVLGYDPTIPSLAVWQANPSGEWEMFVGPTDGLVEHISDPVPYKDSIAFSTVVSTAFGRNIQTYAFNGSELVRLGFTLGTLVTHCALATDNDSLWVIYVENTSGNSHLYILDVLARDFVPTELYNTCGNLDSIDAIHCPADNRVQVLAGRSAGVTVWLRYDPISDLVDATSAYLPTSVLGIDLEINTQNNQPAAIYYDGANVLFRQLAHDSGDFGAHQIIDGAFPTGLDADLAFRGNNGYAYIRRPLDSSRLFRYNTGAWTEVGDSGDPNDNGFDVAVLPLVTSGHVLAFDRDILATTNCYRFTGDPTATVIWTLSPSDTMHCGLTAAAGVDGLHVAYDSSSFDIRTYRSPDAINWSQSAVKNLSTGCELTETSNREVYLSTQGFGSANLWWWNHGTKAWDHQLNRPSDGYVRPLMSESGCNVDVQWAVYDVPTSTLSWNIGNQSAGYTEFTSNPDIGHVWNGTILEGLGMAEAIALVGGTSVTDAQIGILDMGQNKVNPIIERPRYGVVDNEIYDRAIAGCSYMDPWFNVPVTVAWTRYGEFIHPVRYEKPTIGDIRLTEINDFLVSSKYDQRVTATAVNCFGEGAVALLSTITEDYYYMEWTDFGRFEKLPMPEGLKHMNFPQLVVAWDGSWHIIYHDYLTGKIMIRSSL